MGTIAAKRQKTTASRPGEAKNGVPAKVPRAKHNKARELKAREAMRLKVANTVAKRLGAIFKERDINVPDLALKIGCPAMTLYRLLDATHEPSVSTLLALANHFGVKIDDLVT